MSFDGSREWQSTTIGEVADVRTGGTPSRKCAEYWNGSIPWMASGEVHEKYVFDTAEFVTAEGLKNSNASVLPVNSVMLALNGQGKTRGKAAILRRAMACNQSLAAIIPNGGNVPEYFLFYLESQYRELRRLTGDDARNGLNLGLIRNYPILLPPPAEQRRIAEILSSVDEAIQATQAVIEQARTVKDGVLERLLTKGIGHTRFKETEIGAIPEAWGVAKVEEVSEFVTSGSRGWSSYYADCGAAFIRIGNLTRESIFLRPSNIQRVNLPKNATEGVRTRLRAGDVLISITADLGIIGYIEDNSLGEAYVNQHIALVRPHVDSIHPGFLAYSLQSKGAQKRFGILNDAGTKAGLNLPAIRRYRVPLPPITEQAQMFEMMRSFETSLATSIGSLNQLQSAKSAIMADLLTGRRRVSADLPLAAE